MSQHQPQKDTSKEGLFDRGVVLIPYESILKKHVPIRESLGGSCIRIEERILRAW